MENIQNIFFSKENISKLNEKIISTYNLYNLTIKEKKEIVEKLIQNMKITWSSLDLKQINSTNYEY